MSPTPLDIKLYNHVKNIADDKFPTSGVYKSSWIVREYKKRGGKYSGAKPKSSGIKRWYKEDWVDLNRPVKKNGKIVGYSSCGRTSPNQTKYPLCRPTKRVSPRTPTTFKELSPKSIRKAKAAKAKVEDEGKVQFGGSPQFYGKRSSLMICVPDNVAKWADYAFSLKKMGFMGATETGWKRAKQLSTKSEIPIEDVRFMRNWFARHLYTSYPGYKAWRNAGSPKDKHWHNKHAILSWLTWGGNAGFNWINSSRVLSFLNHHFNTDYKKLKLD
jgi:hypothetical protein